jgi:hypothetical protein
MSLSEFTKKLVKSQLASYYDRRVPPHVRDQVRLAHTIRGNSVTLIEQRRSFRDRSAWIDSPISQFRFNPDTSMWTLYCRDRNSKWHEYRPLKPSKDFNDLLLEVERDPTHIFWG